MDTAMPCDTSETVSRADLEWFRSVAAEAARLVEFSHPNFTKRLAMALAKRPDLVAQVRP